MKAHEYWLVRIVLVMSFTACENEAQSNDSEPTSVERKETKKWRI